jgi:hypothetical protein
MKMSHDLKAAAETGTQEKAREFRDAGSELHVPEMANS